MVQMLTGAGFVRSSMILFLNKADVLMEKIKDPQQQIADNFPDFTGELPFERALLSLTSKGNPVRSKTPSISSK